VTGPASLQLRFASQARAALLATFAFCTAAAFAQDWAGCSSDLDSLRVGANDASSDADNAAAAQRKFKSAEDELRQCVQMPQVFDLMRDGCGMKRRELESERSRYRSRLEDLKNGLDAVDAKVRSVGISCGFDFSRVVGPPRAVPQGIQQRDICAVYLRYKDRLPRQSLIDVCLKQLPLEQCKKCLE
jgi:hypothetical protein